MLGAVQTGFGRGSWMRAGRRQGLRHAPGIGGLVAIAVIAAACSSSGSVDASALPKAEVAVVGRAVDATVTSPADLPTFDDTNGHGGVPPGGRYQLGVRNAESVVTSVLDDHFPDDQVVTGTFDTTASPSDAGFGVVCRMKDDDDYYRLGVGNDGEYAIQQVKGGTAKVLTGNGKWISSPALPKTPGLFTVRAECVGDTLTLFEADHEIASVQDRAVSGTRAGVFVETFFKPNATVQVNALSVRAFTDRHQVGDAAAAGWDALVRAQLVAPRCTLLDPKSANGGPGVDAVTQCGTVVFLHAAAPANGASVFNRIVHDADPKLTAVKTLPGCAHHTGIRGPLPAPPGATGAAATSIGSVACIDLGGSTLVVWSHDPGGIVGLARVDTKDRATWHDYGAAWPPFGDVATG
jgi:hypothetical protein